MTPELLDTRPLSYSSLKQFKRSPSHYKHYITAPKDPPSDAMIIGSLVDCRVLTPDRLDANYLLWEGERRSNAGKAAFEALLKQAQDTGALIVTPEQWERSAGMANAITSDAEAMRILGMVTQTQDCIKYQSKGLPIITYLDGRGENGGNPMVLELKTAADASTDKFISAALNMDYHLQAALYSRGVMKTRQRTPEFYYIAVESHEPYAVNVLKADDDFLALGYQELDYLLEDFKRAMESGAFNSGYTWRAPVGYNQLSLPGWAYKKLNP